MKLIYIFLMVLHGSLARFNNKTEFCNNLKCNNIKNLSVCGIREEGDGYRIKLFDSECELIKYGCSVQDKFAYGLINLEYCEHGLGNDANKSKHNNFETLIQYKQTGQNKTDCKLQCSSKEIKVCGIRRDGIGYRVKLFNSNCEMAEYNCKNEIKFVATEFFICNAPSESESNKNTLDTDTTVNVEEKTSEDIEIYDDMHDKFNNLIVVYGNMLNFSDNIDINTTIDNFFAATHVYDLPMKQINGIDLNTRRRILKNAGPVKVFTPWINIPDNKSDDYYHRPTLSSCYHKCPTKCPDTYAPVCGVPGIVAREPSLMFQNHCFMDVAQCKMYWENKSPTAQSSSYIESSFLFCMGDQLNGLYRFLPLIRTLQHMGRLKKKGKFRYRLRNLRFFNNVVAREPNLMG